MSTNPKEEILPCREISVAPEICRGRNFCTGYPRKNPVLWINFRGTGKNPGIRLELGKADGFPKKGKLSRIFPLVRRFDRCR